MAESEKENQLKVMIETARNIKGYTQRELADKLGIRQSTYNDSISGKIKKPDFELLSNIARELDLSLKLLLKAAGYSESVAPFIIDPLENKSDTDLINMIDEFKMFKYDILDWDSKKREQASKIARDISGVQFKIKKQQKLNDNSYTFDDLLKDLDDILREFELIEKKYDYSKLPKDL